MKKMIQTSSYNKQHNISLVNKAFRFLLALLPLSLLLDASAQFIIKEGDDESEIKTRTFVLPYIFSTETLGFGMGLGATYGPQSETLYYGTAYITDNGSSFLMLGGDNLKVPKIERLHLRPWLSFGHFTHMRVYIDGNPKFPNERAGSNESSKNNYREENANDIIADFEFIYTLPWGNFREDPVHTYITQNGLLKENPSGAESWNPLQSGRSTLLFRPYYRKQYTDAEAGETLFFQIGFEHDNRDFVPNPHRGYLFKTTLSHDPNWLAESRQWTALEGELDGFIPLWDTTWSRQQTLALSVWTAYAPTYNIHSNSDDNGKPPYFVGPTLGGFWRMRAYPANRFHDKASIYYSAEYRLMPEWQPFGEIDLLDPLKIRWWQIVGVVEVGRVAPSWDFEMLHSDLKYDYGIGLRGMFYTSVGRLDIMMSEEGTTFSVMFGQSF